MLTHNVCTATRIDYFFYHIRLTRNLIKGQKKNTNGTRESNVKVLILSQTYTASPNQTTWDRPAQTEIVRFLKKSHEKSKKA